MPKLDFLSAVMLTLFITAGAASYAEQVVVTDDGSEVLLKDDGSWVQLSRDRYATSRNGDRIRLRPNGQWDQVVEPGLAGMESEKAPLATSPIKPNAISSAAKADYRLLLDKAEILKVEVKTQKSRRIETRTVFHLALTNQSSVAMELSGLKKSQFSATASSREKFDVIAIQPAQGTLRAGERATIKVVADGSPQWFGIKYMSLKVDAGTFRDGPEQVLSINFDDVVRRKVDAF